jgi:hypothetical protein
MECVPVHSPLTNQTVVSLLEPSEPSQASLKMEPMPQNGMLMQPATSESDARTSFADRLKAAAQLELSSPGLLAKLALNEPSVSNLSGTVLTLSLP